MKVPSRLALILLTIGLIAAGAALFGSDGRVAGLDVGGAGASLFVLSLLGGIALFAARGEEVFPEHMSVAERRAWLGLSFLAIVLATFIREMSALAEHGRIPERIHEMFRFRSMERYVLLVIAWGVMSHLIGRCAGIESDERDLRLRHRADRAGDWTLTLLIIAGITTLASLPIALLDWWLAPIVLANVLIGLLITKSLVEHLILAYYYRRSSGLP